MAKSKNTILGIFLNKLLNHQSERTIGDFVLYKTKNGVSCDTNGGYEFRKNSGSLSGEEAKKEGKRIFKESMENRSHAPITDEELEMIE